MRDGLSRRRGHRLQRPPILDDRRHRVVRLSRLLHLHGTIPRSHHDRGGGSIRSHRRAVFFVVFFFFYDCARGSRSSSESGSCIRCGSGFLRVRCARGLASWAIPSAQTACSHRTNENRGWVWWWWCWACRGQEDGRKWRWGRLGWCLWAPGGGGEGASGWVGGIGGGGEEWARLGLLMRHSFVELWRGSVSWLASSIDVGAAGICSFSSIPESSFTFWLILRSQHPNQICTIRVSWFCYLCIFTFWDRGGDRGRETHAIGVLPGYCLKEDVLSLPALFHSFWLLKRRLFSLSFPSSKLQQSSTGTFFLKGHLR